MKIIENLSLHEIGHCLQALFLKCISCDDITKLSGGVRHHCDWLHQNHPLGVLKSGLCSHLTGYSGFHFISPGFGHIITQQDYSTTQFWICFESVNQLNSPIQQIALNTLEDFFQEEILVIPKKT